MVHEDESVDIPVGKLRFWNVQPRTGARRKPSQELQRQIARHGVKEPLVVEPFGNNGEYLVLGGERRGRAAIDARHKTVPARIVQPRDDAERLTIALRDNARHGDRNTSSDLALALIRLKDEAEATSLEEWADRTGFSIETVRRCLQMRSLVPALRRHLDSGARISGRRFSFEQLYKLSQLKEESQASTAAKMAEAATTREANEILESALQKTRTRERPKAHPSHRFGWMSAALQREVDAIAATGRRPDLAEVMAAAGDRSEDLRRILDSGIQALTSLQEALPKS